MDTYHIMQLMMVHWVYGDGRCGKKVWIYFDWHDSSQLANLKLRCEQMACLYPVIKLNKEQVWVVCLISLWQYLRGLKSWNTFQFNLLKKITIIMFYYPGSSGFSMPDAMLRRKRNRCEQPFASLIEPPSSLMDK